jgi:molybdate transport system substrate-binding protein
LNRRAAACFLAALAVAGLAAAALLLSAAPSAGTAASARITVYAAASLTNVFPLIDRGPRYSFGGSNTLAAQIRQGAPTDVFASANMALPQQLFKKNLCSKPVAFTRNALVIVVPRSNPANLRSIYGLARRGVKLVIAGPGVPVGGYTLQVLRKMGLSAAILPNVVSRETDVREVLAKVILGEADAGFVYATDAKVAGGRVSVLKVPAWAQPKLQYGICVVSSSSNKSAARAFVNKVLAGPGQEKLRAAGFLPRAKPKPRR